MGGGWRVDAVELPHGDRPATWWVDRRGGRVDRPVADAEALPGRYVAWGLADAHAHPAVGWTAAGPAPRDAAAASAQLVAWARDGIALVRDVGSPGGVALDVLPEPGLPAMTSAGRFLAPGGRYFPELLVEAVEEEDLVTAALAELERGARWVKVIGDFPRVPEFTDPAQTYSTPALAQLCAAVHDRGARVAIHSTFPNLDDVIDAGVDSIEHGTAMTVATLEAMAARGIAWTPTLCAAFAVADDPEAPPQRRDLANEARERFRELVPMAVRLGVPVLVGTDVVGTVAREVALLADLGLDPRDALAAATVVPRTFLGEGREGADIVTYDADPRDDPDILAHPAAVVVGSVRLR
jgi:imidazolonepropionase-like amidohydrolase